MFLFLFQSSFLDFWNIFLLIGIPIVCLISVAYFQPQLVMEYLSRQCEHKVFYFANTDHKCCALTIDDSPTKFTHEILDILKEHQVVATFFIISNQIAGNEDVMQRIIKEGHHMGNHLTEDQPSIRYNTIEFEENLLVCEKNIEKYQQPSNNRVKWLRPGSGWFTSEMLNTAHRNNYRLCLGNVYPHDAQIASELLNSSYLLQRTRKGSIIIVHDRSWTINVLRKALPKLKTQYSFVSLHELETMDSKKYSSKQQ